MVCLEVWHHHAQCTTERALAMEWALKLKVLTAALMFCLLAEWGNHFASHGMVPAREIEQPRHLLHAKVALGGHSGPARRTVSQSGETVTANQVTLGALFDRWSDMVEADWALEEEKQLAGVY